MTRIEKFEDIIAWQKADLLVIDLYKIFGSLKDFSFKDQILRAAVSIMNNIAEGFERKSNKDFRKFLYIAKGSCAEVRSMLRLAGQLGYVSDDQVLILINQTLEISRVLGGLMRNLVI